jgi:pimeloyl-ACP methyl ester carboxylesterase
MTPLTLRANGLSFSALAAGPEDGPLALLLHGFPELSRSWRHQLPALSAAGYRAVAPDLRGYGDSGRGGPYDLDTLTADVAGLVRALGRERAVVIGHDWGGAIAWGTAVLRPEVVDRLVVLNCPHPAVLAEELVRNPRQLLRSSYMLFFQLPLVPEWTLTRRHAAAVARALRGGSAVRSAWPREELDRYREAFLRPGAASAALGYYRAAFRRPAGFRRAALAHPIAAPTLVVWSARDRFLGVEMIAPARMAPYLAPGNVPRIVLLEDAGHFVQNEAPARVNAAVVGWLVSGGGR